MYLIYYILVILNIFQQQKVGRYLIVSLTTDEYVRKGFNRPVFNQYQRAEVLSSIKNIDFVVFLALIV